jgi:pimeloyl-ACP methyl ester carboxylesterase
VESPVPTSALTPLASDDVVVPPPDPGAEPAAFMVEADDGTRIHFLDWGEPGQAPGGRIDGPAAGTAEGGRGPGSPAVAPAVLLVHGVAQTAWAWVPIARRLARLAHVVAADLRGHGLSDAPQDGYDLATLAGDALAAAEGAGLLQVRVPGGHVEGAADRAATPPGDAPAGTRLVVAGHGFGAAVAAACAARLGPACAGLVLVDGGWDDADRIAGTTLDEWLRSVEEPPETLRSMAAFLADREAYDPPSWDGDQERAARASVVELPAGRVVSSARRHAIERVGETLLAHDPVATVAALEIPIVALAARDDGAGMRMAALVRCGAAIVAAGHAAPRYRSFPADGHNLMRYRPDAVAGAILALATAPAVPSPG